MEKSEDNLALVAFTTLAPLSVGGLVGLLLLRPQAAQVGLDSAGTALLITALLALAASFLHLGRPFKAYRALWRLSTSWLSREVTLFGIFILCLAAYILPLSAPGWVEARGLMGILAAVIGMVALIATGAVYRLQARPAWNHWSTVVQFAVGALSAGLLTGWLTWSSVGAGGLASATGEAMLGPIAGVALLLSPILTWIRYNRLQKGSAEARETWRLVYGKYRWILAARIVGAGVGLILLLLGGWAIAWLFATLGDIADRVLFFNTAVPVSLPARAGVPIFSTSTVGRC